MEATTISSLERLAVRAHQHGTPWKDWIATYGDQVRELRGDDVEGYRRFILRLLQLVVAGNLDGHEPIPTGDLWGTPFCGVAGELEIHQQSFFNVSPEYS